LSSKTVREMVSKIAKSSLLVLVCLHEALGHGFMYFPTSWNSRNEVVPCNGLKGAHFGYTYPQPEVVCDENSDTERCSSSAMKNGWSTDWFTNFTFVPGTGLSMSEEMYSSGRTWVRVEGEKRYNPWAQPGTAPIYGEGCGLNGGNPNGCQGDYEDSNPFGTCCGGTPTSCGGYTGGKSALEHYSDGLFGEPASTVWTRGKAEPVYWTTGAGHKGGYAYRLCKIPPGGVSQITEECFNQGHLDFAGDSTWIYSKMKPYKVHDYTKWQEVPAVRTKVGTYPPGSEWAKIISPYVDKANGWGFKDFVQIPENIEPGAYVMSFRWDSQKTPQIWSNCANIEVV